MKTEVDCWKRSTKIVSQGWGKPGKVQEFFFNVEELWINDQSSIRIRYDVTFFKEFISKFPVLAKLLMIAVLENKHFSIIIAGRVKRPDECHLGESKVTVTCHIHISTNFKELS